MRFAFLIVILFLAGAGATSTADAAGVGTALGDWTVWVRDSNLGKLAAAALLSGAVWAVNIMRGRFSDRSGVIQVALMSLIGGILTSVATGNPIDQKLIEAVVAIALTAIGGYTAVKRGVLPPRGGGGASVEVVGTIEVPVAAGEQEPAKQDSSP